VALSASQAVRLTRALRELCGSTWSDQELTQAQLVGAFSSESRVAAATRTSWESATNPKTPPVTRISTYAYFFCTERSLEGEPRLIAEDQLTDVELDRSRDLESNLMALSYPENRKVRRSFQFDVGPVIVICPTAPPDVQGPLAEEQDPNFTKMRQHGDLDALIELCGHLRADNPSLDVFHGTTTGVMADDFSNVILLGGIGWNTSAARFQRATCQVPIEQASVDDCRVETSSRLSHPTVRFPSIRKMKIWARARSSSQMWTTSRGSAIPFSTAERSPSATVFTAAVCLAPCAASRMPKSEKQTRSGEFAILLRVPVVQNQTLSPDLQDPSARLYEWSPNQDGVQ
jgi:hypothetical protein